MLPLKTILHPTDFSEAAKHAFEVACALARDHAGSLVLLYVVPPPMSYGETLARQPPDSFYRQMWNKIHELETPAGIRVEHRLEDGDPTRMILEVARDTNCDLIVMGTHGRTGLSRLLMGSVAEKVLRRAPCPVLTVKAANVKVAETSREELVNT